MSFLCARAVEPRGAVAHNLDQLEDPVLRNGGIHDTLTLPKHHLLKNAVDSGADMQQLFLREAIFQEGGCISDGLALQLGRLSALQELDQDLKGRVHAA